VWQNPEPQGNITQKIFPLDANNIFGVATYGTFFKSTNGGINWTIFNCIDSISFPFDNIFFLNVNTGWLCSILGKKTLKTTNSGNNWVVQDDTLLQSFYGIFFINRDIGFMTGSQLIFKTTNSGGNWISVNIPSVTDVYSSPFFINENTGWVIGTISNAYGTSRIFKTTNSGLNWIQQNNISGYYSKVQFINPYTGYLCGGEGIQGGEYMCSRLYKTTNSGSNWDRVNADSCPRLLYMNFLNENTGWVSSGDSIHLTLDGCITWKTKKNYYCNSISDNDFYNIFGWGSGACISKSTNSGEKFSVLSKVTKYTCFQDVKFFNENTGVVLEYGGVYRTTDGGNNWINTDLDSLIDFGSHQISFIDDNTGWIVNSNYNKIYKSTNSGINWSLDDYQMKNDTAIYTCVTSQRIIKIIGYHTISSSSDYGNSWTSIQSSKWGYYYFFDQNSGWMFSSGSLYKTTNGGINWITYLPVTNYSFHYGYFLNLNTGWVSSGNNNDTILITKDGGANWQKVSLNCSDLWYLTPKLFINENTGWACGELCITSPGIPVSIIAKTTNGGLNWGFSIYGSDNVFGGISFINENTGWIAGTGFIMKTTTGGTSYVKNISLNNTPENYLLFQNYPNPFNPTTNIKYQITNNKFVTLKVYDILGREVITLVNEKQTVGTYEVTFDASKYSSGVYFYRLKAGDFVETRKMVLIK
jgi:photosystem II stability/assembly factor-like uncharacterized protein